MPLFWLIVSHTSRQLRRQEQHNTALIRTASALRKSETRLRDFVEMASDWLWEQDADLRFTEIGMETPLLVRGDQSHIGKRRLDLNDTIIAPEPPGRTTNGTSWRASRFAISAIAGSVPTASRIHVSINIGTPIYDDAGQFTGYRGIGREITAEVEAAAKLHNTMDRAEQAETLFHDAVNSMSEGFVFYDSQDRLILCNDAYRRLYPATARPSWSLG